MTVKPLSFSQALEEVQKEARSGEGPGAAAARVPAGAAAKPKLVPIEDILLDIMEEDEGDEGATAEAGADES